MFLAEDIMTSPTKTIGKENNVKEALELLAENNISGIPVIDQDNKIIGIISGADIIRYSQQNKLVPSSKTSAWLAPLGNADDDLLMIRSGYEKLYRTLVEQIMTKKVYTASKDTPISDLAKLMSRRNVNRIPIVSKDNQVIGIVTRNDLVKYMAGAES